MGMIGAVWREFIGLFVDDGALALQVILLLAALALLVPGGIMPSMVAALVLVAGLLLILAASVLRQARKARAR
jgi:hypothetical protein